MLLYIALIILLLLVFIKRREPFESKNALFVMCGNARSFIECIDSCYEHVITKLFNGTNTKITILLYLKLNDINHIIYNSFKDNNRKDINDKLIELKKYNIHIESILLDDNEINDTEILTLVKDREKYTNFFSFDENLIRALQCHYNFEACGKKILSYQKQHNMEFDTFVYIRPDLFFTKDCKHISTYNDKKVTLGISDPLNFNRPDHSAIIPKEHFYPFFFDRMKLYKNNTTEYYVDAESVYLQTIDYERGKIGEFYIKRQGVNAKRAINSIFTYVI